MDKFLKLALIAGGAYVLYTYLKSSGIIDGGTETFTDSAALLAYCKANPNGTAVFNSGGAKYSAPCSQWTATNQKPTTATNTPTGQATPANTTTESANPAATPAIVLQMQDLTGLQTTGIDGWAWAYQQVTGKTITTQQITALISAAGGDRSKAMTASQFYSLFTSTTGMSGYHPAAWNQIAMLTRRIQ